jgi:predicted phosphodiesterase
MNTRNTYNCLHVFIIIVFNFSIALSQATCPNPSFSFGLIADCQCGSASCQSKDHLQDCVDYFNQENIEFLGHLGDFIQSDYANFNVVLPIIQQSTAPVKFALGNHDFDIPDSEKPNLPTLLQMPDFYYDEVIDNWRFIFIETTETGAYAQAAHPNVTVCGIAGLSSTQLTWISQRIQLAEQNDENVILFGHHPHEFLCNGAALRAILEASPNVVAYMTGHRHGGNYEMLNNVHYLTLTSMLNRTESTYSEVTISNDSILVTGFGDQSDFVLTYTVAATFDQDNDGVCDDVDQCPGTDDTIIGQTCDDNDPCTTGETFDSNCTCSGGIFQDSDGDGICDANDQCANFDDNLIGQPCDDNNPCTIGETYAMDCNCSGGMFQDSDGDGICNANDQCANFDDNLIGQPCDDNNPCTIGETYAMDCNCSGGMFQDSDGDGICNANDQCANFDDNLIGQACDDNNPCTTGEVYDTNCLCSGGSLADQDNDGVCDSADQCPGINDNLIGQNCDDNDPCTTGETYDMNCNCSGGMSIDSDNDGICDMLDQCPGFDDAIDTNFNGTSDHCETTPLSSCSSIIFLNGSESFYHHQVSNRIFSQQLIDGFLVKYSAGNQIDLLVDFEVKQGTVFEAVIEDCQ